MTRAHADDGTEDGDTTSSLALVAPSHGAAVSTVDVTAAFREHIAFVWRVLLCSGVPRGMLDDAVQDVFLIVHRRRDDYDGRAPLRHWIYGIAKGVGRNHRRRLRRWLERVTELPALAEAPRQQVQVEHRDQLSVVALLLQRLNADQREVFMLVQIDGMTAPEVARLLGISVNTVSSRLRLARERFEKLAAAFDAHVRGGGHARTTQ